MKKLLTLLILTSYTMLSFALSDITIGGYLFTDSNNDQCYEISSKEHLIALSLHPEYLDSRSFELTTDIIFNPDPTKEDWNNDGNADGAGTKGFTPIKARQYTVEYNTKQTKLNLFDGNNFTIKNLYINRPNENNVGLFTELYNIAERNNYENPTTTKNALRNFNLVDCNINGKDNTGGILGFGVRVVIRECQITGTITGNDHVGGIVGGISVSHVFSSYSNAFIKGNNSVGGIAGTSFSGGSVNFIPNSSKIESGLIKSTVLGKSNAGSIVGLCEYVNTYYCLSTGHTSNNGSYGKSYAYATFPASMKYQKCYYDIQTSSIKAYDESLFEEIPLLTEDFTTTNLPLQYGYRYYTPWVRVDKGRPYFYYQKASVDNYMIDGTNHIIGNINLNPSYSINIVKTGAKYSLIQDQPVWNEVLFDSINTIDGYIPNLEKGIDYYIHPFAEDENGMRYYGDMIKKQDTKVIFHANNSTLEQTESQIPLHSYILPSFDTFKTKGQEIVEWNTQAQGNNGTSYFDGDKILIDSDIINLYAQWELSTHTLTYDKNTGVGDMSEQVFNYNQTVSLLTNTFEKTGYKLAEWNTKADGSGKGFKDQHNFLMPDSSITLYAQWEIDGYLISFYPNGGEGNITPLLLESGTDTILPQNTFTKTDYDFTEWNTRADGSGISFASLDRITMSNNDFNLYAQWKINIHNITFYPNGGQGNIEPLTLKIGADTLLSPNIFTNLGYQFSGWNSESDGSGMHFANEASITMSDSDIKLYAQWTANNYNINYNTNGGTGFIASQEVSYGQQTTLSTNTLSRHGYTFKDWNTDVNGLGDRYIDEDLITPGIGDIELYAQWNAIPYTISYQNTDGVPNVNPSSYTTTTPTLVLSHIIQHNKAFDGWYNDSLYTHPVMEIAQGSTGDRTFYAKWSNKYNLVYFSNGGTGNTQIENLTVIGANYTTKDNMFTRNGYEFKEWNSLPDGTGITYEQNQDIILDDNIDFVLYAIWQPIEYAITYYNADDASNNNITNYTPATPTFVFSDLVRDGYTFYGWFSDSLLTNEITFMPKGSMGDTSLYAQIDINYYDIIYYSNGGNGYSVKQQFPYHTDTTLLNTPFSRKGYQFLGWNTSPSGNGTHYDAHDKIEDIEDDLTLYAQWEIQEYSVSYNNLQNSININPKKYTLYTPSQVLNSLSQTGHTFDGWFLDEQYTSPIALIELGDTGNINLYAKWTTNNYAIHYKSNSGNGTMNSQNIPFNKDTLLSTNAFERKGYQFTHWNTSADDSGSSYTDEQTIKMNDSDLTLYAQWHCNEYSITYYNLKESINENIKTYDINTSSALTPLTKKGYTFTGWFSDDNYASSISTITPGDTGNLSLYAKWERNTYSINYNSNSGDGIMISQNLLYNQDTLLTANTFTKKGYQFSHWNTKADDSGTSYTDTQRLVMSNENLSLFAQWDLNQYSITYHDNFNIINPNPKIYDVNTTKELTPLSSEGYTFEGWFSDDSFSNRITSLESGDTGHLELFAKWKIKVLQVNIDGGTGGTITIDNFANTDFPMTCQYWQSIINIEARNASDKVFAIWSDGNTENPRNLHSITSDTSITALWDQLVLIDITDTIKTYNGDIQEPRIALSEKAKYTLRYKEENSSVWLNLKPKHAGTYDVLCEINENGLQGELQRKFIITPKPIAVITTDSLSKKVGNPDPKAFQYEVNGLIDGDYTTGNLSRLSGESPGYYPTQLGSLSIICPDDNSSMCINNFRNQNYTIDFTSSDFFIDSKIKIVCKWEYMLIVNNGNEDYASYQWYKDGKAIAGANKQYYYNDAHTLCGNYQCEVSFIGNSSKIMTEEKTYSYCQATSNRSVAVYPNPCQTNQELTIDIVNDTAVSNNKYEAKIISIEGRIIQHDFLNNWDKSIINTPSITGVYRVIVLEGDQLIYNESLIVQ